MQYLSRRTRVVGMLAALLIGLAGFASPIFAADADMAAVAALEKIFAGDTVPQGVPQLKAMQDHLQKLTEKVIPCTVGVRVGQAQGSGVIVSKDGFVLTAAHVCGKPGVKVTFILHDGSTVEGKTLGINRTIDSGLMKIESDKEWPHLEMGASGGLKEGQWCVATGHPGGYEKGRKPVVRFGRVLHNQDTVVMTDCTLVGGDSGGPLFDMQGRVIGINSRIANPLNANMHVPVNTFKDTWDRLAAGEAWGNMPGTTPYLGVQGSQDNNDPVINHVVPGTPAEKAGFKVGDRVLKFDDKEIKEFPELSARVADKSPGDKVKIVVQRGEETVELDVTIGKRGE